MFYYSLEDLSHDPKLASALGEMVITWANADQALLGTMARVLNANLNFVQPAFYRLPTFEARIKFIRALISEWRAPKGFSKASIDTATSKLAKLASTRNHWIHGVWCLAEDKSETVIFDHRSPVGSPGRRKAVKAADVRNHIIAVKKRCEHLQKLIKWGDLSA